jgi:hypothetical protein
MPASALAQTGMAVTQGAPAAWPEVAVCHHDTVEQLRARGADYVIASLSEGLPL